MRMKLLPLMFSSLLFAGAAQAAEKRFGIGWTCNFARPACWVIIAAFVVLITGIMLFSFVLLG